MGNLERKDPIALLRSGPGPNPLPEHLLALLKRKFPAAAPWPIPQGPFEPDSPPVDGALLRALHAMGPAVAVRVDLVSRARVALGMGSEDLVRARLAEVHHVP